MPEKHGFRLPRRSWTSERSCCTPMRLVRLLHVAWHVRSLLAVHML